MVFLIGLACMAAGIAGLALLAWVIQFSVRNGIRRSGLIPLDRLYEIERFEAGDPQRLSVDGLREKYGDGAESHMRKFVDDRTSSRSWKALIVAFVEGVDRGDCRHCGFGAFVRRRGCCV